MNIDTLHKRFEFWRQILLVTAGASIILFVQAVLTYLESGSQIFPVSWYGTWFIVLIASLLPGFVLLWGRHWMRLPLRQRLNTIFGYFSVAWFTVLPVGMQLGPYATETNNFILFGVAVLIAVAYFWLQRRSMETLGEMFP